jgi:hypothetical protein
MGAPNGGRYRHHQGYISYMFLHAQCENRETHLVYSDSAQVPIKY